VPLRSRPGEEMKAANLRTVSRRKQIKDGSLSSVRQAAAICNVSPPVIRRWLSLGLIAEPPWTVEQLQNARDLTDPESRRRGNRAAHGTITRWNAGCSCAKCRRFQSDDAKARGRRRAQERLPGDLRQQLLDAIYAGQPFRTVLSDLGLTSNQVWGLTKTDTEWSESLEEALTATRRGDLEHGSNAAYKHGVFARTVGSINGGVLPRTALNALTVSKEQSATIQSTMSAFLI
jgi:hypothetical protein